MDFIIQNKEWLFSGAGIAFVGAVWGYFVKKKKGEKSVVQKIKSGDGSTNIQGRGNVQVTFGEKKND